MAEHQHTYRTMPASEEYRDGWDRIYAKKVDWRIPRTLDGLHASIMALFGAWAASIHINSRPHEPLMTGFGEIPKVGENPDECIVTRVWEGFRIEGHGKTREEAIADAWKRVHACPDLGQLEARWRKELELRHDRDFESDEDRWAVWGRLMVSPLSETR